MFEEIYARSLLVDETICRRLSCLLVSQSVDQAFPELSQILDRPLPALDSYPEHNRFQASHLDEQLVA